MPSYDRIIVEKNVPATMRDGTILRANVYRPAEGGPFPVALTRLPYGKDFALATRRPRPDPPRRSGLYRRHPGCARALCLGRRLATVRARVRGRLRHGRVGRPTARCGWSGGDVGALLLRDDAVASRRDRATGPARPDAGDHLGRVPQRHDLPGRGARVGPRALLAADLPRRRQPPPRIRVRPRRADAAGRRARRPDRPASPRPTRICR